MTKRQTFTLIRHLRNGKNVTDGGLTPGRLRGLISLALTDNGLASKAEAGQFVQGIPSGGVQTRHEHSSGYAFTVRREDTAGAVYSTAYTPV